MKKIVFIVLGWVFLWFSWAPATAQQTNQTTTRITGSLTSGTIDSQFFYINRISRTQDGMKLIRRNNLDLIQKNIADTLKRFRQEVALHQDSITGLSKEIIAYRDSINQTRQQLKEAQSKGETVSFLGMDIKEGLYHVVVWIIILALFVVCLVIMASMRRNTVLAREAKTNLSDLQNELDQQRKKSLEKEQKLMRQLQDEINKRNA